MYTIALHIITHRWSQRMRQIILFISLLYLQSLFAEAHIECFNCHTSDVVDFNVIDAPLLAQQPLLCISCHDGSAGPSEHKVSITPIVAQPSSLPLVDGMVNCTSCHDPHALDATKLRLPSEQLCFDCHNL